MVTTIYWKYLSANWTLDDQEDVITCSDPVMCLDFAIEVEGADIDRLQEEVIKSENPDLAYCFATEVVGANIEQIRQHFPEISDDIDAYIMREALK